MPRGRFAELISEVDRAVFRRCGGPGPKESVIGRMAMRRMPSSAQRNRDASGAACDRGVGRSQASEPVSLRQSARRGRSSGGVFSNNGTRVHLHDADGRAAPRSRWSAWAIWPAPR